MRLSIFIFLFTKSHTALAFHSNLFGNPSPHSLFIKKTFETIHFESRVIEKSLRSLEDDNDNDDDDDDNDDTYSSSGTCLNPCVQFDYEISLPNSKYTQVITNLLEIEKQNDDTMNIVVAQKLRDYFDSIYNDPRAPNAKRFVWDPWYIKCSEGKDGTLAPLPDDSNAIDNDINDQDRNNDPLFNEDVLLDMNINPKVIKGEREAVGNQIQYSLKRVQALTFFSNTESVAENVDPVEDADSLSLYDEFIEEITALGRSIGLQSTTPPWLSLYTENDLQNFHTDTSHGPMAWVYSLPPPSPPSPNPSSKSSPPPYIGGETMLLHPSVLNYWTLFGNSDNSGKETPSLIRFIPTTTLGQCITFDPRVPHGVSQVKMTHPNDIRQGRLVIHGWFADPEVIWKGFIEEPNTDNMERLNEVLDPLIQTLGNGEIGRVMGYLAVKLGVNPDGSVQTVNAVCDTLVADPNDFRGIVGYDEEDRPVIEDAVADVKLTIYEALKGMYFSQLYHDDEDLDNNDETIIYGMREVIVPFAFE